MTSVKGKPPDESVVILNKLTTDQVCVFGRNMGVPGCFSKLKFLCHVAIAQDNCGHRQLGYLLCRFGSVLKSMITHYVLLSWKGLLFADGIHPKQQHIHARHNLC